MMIRQSTRHGESMQKHGEIACTRCTKTISMQNKEEMGVVVVKSDQGV
jgi:DNA-directed RNA polymerase subunit RPC12/RpoP